MVQIIETNYISQLHFVNLLILENNLFWVEAFTVDFR